MVTTNVEPAPGVLVAVIAPSCLSTPGDSTPIATRLREGREG
jgi:hypothetical protein